MKDGENVDPVPYTTSPSGEEVVGDGETGAYWLFGVKIVAPKGVKIAEGDEAIGLKITKKVEEEEDAVNSYKIGKESDYDGFLFYGSAGKEKVTGSDADTTRKGQYVLEITWNSNFKETITINYDVDVKAYVTEEEPGA